MRSRTKAEQKILERALSRFKRAQDAETDNHEYAREDLRFADGDQWAESIRLERQAEDRPALVCNRIPAFLRQIINDMRKTRPAIKVRPTDDKADAQTATILNGMIRAIEQDSGAEAAYDYAGEYAVKMGWGFWRITTDYEDDEGFEQIIKVKRIRDQLSVWMDPDTAEADSSDIKWCFIEEWLGRDEFREKYPNEDVTEWPAAGDSYEKDWYTQDKVRLAEYWTVEETPTVTTLMSDGTKLKGKFTPEQTTQLYEDHFKNGTAYPVNSRKHKQRKVVQRIMTASGVLETTEWPGKYIPVVRILGEEIVISGETRRKGMVRDMSDTQRSYNYMRSASAERALLAPKAPIIGARGAFADPKWRDSNKKNFPYLEYEPIPGEPPPSRQPPVDISPGLVNEIQMCAEELKAITGIYDPALGNRANEVSGIAIRERKEESDVSNFHYTDNLARGQRFNGIILIDLIQKVYTGDRIVSILHGDGREERVQLNQPFMDDKGKQQNYDLTVGRYDAVVDVGPSYATQEKESAEGMLEFGKIYPESMPLMGDLVVKSMRWPNSEELSKRLQLALPPEILKGESPQIAQILQQSEQEKSQLQQVIQQLQQYAQQLQQALTDKQGETALKQREIERKEEETKNKHIEGMTKLEIDSNKDLGQFGAYM